MRPEISAPHPAAPLLRALQECLLPALERDFRGHFVIARARRKQMIFPPNVRALPLKLRGPRVAMRDSREVPRVSRLFARWPDDGMHQLRLSKMVAVVSGQAGLRLGDYILQCPAGTLLFLPTGVPHVNGEISHLETLPPEVQRCSLLWMTPLANGLECRICHSVGTEHLHAAQGEKVFLHRPQLLQLFYLLVEAAEETTPDWLEAGDAHQFSTPVLQSLLLALLRTILRDIHDEQFLLQNVPPYEQETSSAGDDPIDQAVQYVSTHHARSLTLDDVARRFFMSRAQFTRKFRERTGQSFLEFLNARRLEQARELLAETDWTAVMIAHTVGFGSTAYFHRLFRRETGVSPMQFRARTRRESMHRQKVSNRSTR